MIETADHLRPYQVNGVDAVFEQWDKGIQATLIDQATGTGKTVEIAEVVRRAQPKRALILAHRRELVWQGHEKIEKFTGLNVEVEMAGERASVNLFSKCHAVVSSVQSQTPGRRSDPNSFDLLIIDEAHHVKPGNKSYLDVINHYKQNPNLKILGVTATVEPACLKVFESIAYSYPLLTAISEGYLVNVEQQMVEVFGLDYSHVRTTAGDLNGADLAAVVENERICQGMITATLETMFGVPNGALNDLPIEKWSEYLFADGKPKRNLIFTVSVAQAKMMSDILNRVHPGISAWVCGDSNLVSEERRAEIGEDFNNGKLLIVCNCGVYSEGYDNPGIEMVTMARPTKSKTLFTQQIGRGTRTLEGTIDGLNTAEERLAAISASTKKSLLVLDFVGNCGKHKLISAVDLLGDKFSEEVRERARKKVTKAAKPQNMAELLKLSEEELAAEKLERDRQEAARKARLVAKASYLLTSLDPFERLKVKRQPPSAWEKRNGFVLSEKQRAVIRNLGVSPDEISVSCARKLIGAHFNGPCSEAQAKVLKKFGYETNCSKKEASAIIEALAKNNWQRPVEQPA
jgi:superfamily II DNA or RNA helicase